MKILLLSPNQISKYNWGHQLFRNEIGGQNDVVFYGEGYPKKFNPSLSVNQIIDKYYGESKPDFILTYGYRYTKPFPGLGESKVPKVHISVDYFDKSGDFKGTMEGQNKFFREYKPDLVFGVVGRVVRNLKENQISNKIFLLPFAVDTWIYKRNILERVNDVLAAFTTRDDVYPNRTKVHRLLSNMDLMGVVTKRISHYSLIQAINKAKISITSNNIFSSLSMRYTEVLSSGGFLLADKPEDFTELGYVDGKHLVLYKGLDDLKEKIYYYLKHDKEREEIANNGMKFVQTYHSCEIRAKQFRDIVKREL